MRASPASMRCRCSPTPALKANMRACSPSAPITAAAARARNVCLIPASAHGTNPASAHMAGMRVVVVACDGDGNVDVADLRAKAREHAEQLAALMITYPSTHGVFEPEIRDICDIVHAARRPGLSRRRQSQCPGRAGAARRLRRRCLPYQPAQDLLHSPRRRRPGHGADRRARRISRPFLPGTSAAGAGADMPVGPVSAAPFGSASILPISWAYMSDDGRRGADGGDARSRFSMPITSPARLGRPLPAPVQGRARARRARVHHRHCARSRRPPASASMMSPSG